MLLYYHKLNKIKLNTFERKNIMLCPRCKSTMNKKFHFENGKKFQYSECSKCHEKTKNKRIHFDTDKEKIILN